MASEIIITLVGLFCTTVSSLVTYMFTRKKYNSEVEAQHIENIKEAMNTYKAMVSDTLNEQNKKIQYLQEENDKLKQQINVLQSQLVNLLMSKSLADISTMAQSNVASNPSDIDPLAMKDM